MLDEKNVRKCILISRPCQKICDGRKIWDFQRNLKEKLIKGKFSWKVINKDTVLPGMDRGNVFKLHGGFDIEVALERKEKENWTKKMDVNVF